MNRNAYRQYSQVQIKTANKGKLIVMLYQGAIRFMKKALIQLEQKDMEGKGKSLIRAQDIVLELLYALDQDMLAKGNELALNLQRLYLYCYRRLVRANVDMNPEPIKEVAELMASLLEAWEKVVGSQVEPEAEKQVQPRVAITG
ncbi:MAG: flagellar export chaperone FliS [Candidatus Latescibacteria bacterium]|nr:flagellar export chaperone FliS [Candidatus Latescibacterota bacterium]